LFGTNIALSSCELNFFKKMNNLIDMRSDTLTKPSEEMLEYSFEAKVGDDCYGEDQEVKKLEMYVAEMCNMEDALLTPSGTMSNQIALGALTKKGDEIICDFNSHIHFFESAQTSAFHQVNLNPVTTDIGILSVESITQAIGRKARWSQMYSHPSLIVLENSNNASGGSTYNIQNLESIFEFAKQNSLNIFLDGARIFNAILARKYPLNLVTRYVDMMSICFGKGLRCPFGSILVGKKEHIARARILRKWMGGSLHQSGYLAKMAYFALENNVEKLESDNIAAFVIAKALEKSKLFQITYHGTNMLYFKPIITFDTDQFVQDCTKNHVRFLEWKPNLFRAVTYNEISNEKAMIASQVIINSCLESSIHSKIDRGICA
jgi:threonine aldolase